MALLGSVSNSLTHLTTSLLHCALDLTYHQPPPHPSLNVLCTSHHVVPWPRCCPVAQKLLFIMSYNIYHWTAFCALCCNVIHAWAVQGDCAAQAYQYVWEIRGVKTFETGRSARSTKQSGAKVQLVHFYANTVTRQTKKDCPKVCCPQWCRLGALDSSVGNTHFIFLTLLFFSLFFSKARAQKRWCVEHDWRGRRRGLGRKRENSIPAWWGVLLSNRCTNVVLALYDSSALYFSTHTIN